MSLNFAKRHYNSLEPVAEYFYQHEELFATHITVLNLMTTAPFAMVIKRGEATFNQFH